MAEIKDLNKEIDKKLEDERLKNEKYEDDLVDTDDLTVPANLDDLEEPPVDELEEISQEELENALIIDDVTLNDPVKLYLKEIGSENRRMLIPRYIHGIACFPNDWSSDLYAPKIRAEDFTY